MGQFTQDGNLSLFCSTCRHLYGQTFYRNHLLRALGQNSGSLNPKKNFKVFPKRPKKARFKPLFPGFPKKKHENWVTSACKSFMKIMDIHFYFLGYKNDAIIQDFTAYCAIENEQMVNV